MNIDMASQSEQNSEFVKWLKQWHEGIQSRVSADETGTRRQANRRPAGRREGDYEAQARAEGLNAERHCVRATTPTEKEASLLIRVRLNRAGI